MKRRKFRVKEEVLATGESRFIIEEKEMFLWGPCSIVVFKDKEKALNFIKAWTVVDVKYHYLT